MRPRPIPAIKAFLAADRPERKGCLVVDALMPSMGGIALIERLKAGNRNLPAITLTGHANIAMVVRAMKAEAADFPEKPVRPDELLASIERASERSHGSAKLAVGARRRPSVPPA